MSFFFFFSRYESRCSLQFLGVGLSDGAPCYATSICSHNLNLRRRGRVRLACDFTVIKTGERKKL